MNLTDIRNDIFARRPEFKKVVEAWGEKTLLEYYTQDFQTLSAPSPLVLDALQKQTTRVLGNNVGIHARVAVASQKWVNTADHHGLLHHPYFYAAALARSNEVVRKDLQATVTLSFGGVSLANDSFPRGFSFHDTNLNLQKVFFKSLKDRRLPVYALAPMAKAELLHEKERCFSLQLPKSAQQKLQYFFELMCRDERVWLQETYSAQLTILNAILWKALFGDTRGDFAYVQLDDIANELLLTKYLVQKTDVHSLLFDPAWRTEFITLFSGIAGAHSESGGTHFFWYIDYVQQTRRTLIVKGNALVTKEGDVSIDLSPERIAEGLRTRELMPATALLLMVQGLEALTCGGGPNQLQYLSLYTQKWNQMYTHFKVPKQIAPLTTILTELGALFAVGTPKIGHQKIATLIDLLLYAENPQSVIDTALQTTTIESMIDAMLPTYYSLVVKQKVVMDEVMQLSHIAIDGC